ncbi:Short-chain dehydrogenase/reductase SDR [Penicillium expansum]|uniref:Short-chain dehydrogenase/reductase SDR n=1 Tax=Penicillium expansum TaxID=27334 RepID=A0A0A2IAK0_PENEN|nr:Short-chain dehydrogenase/reductase SDR [Penicillium expansum]KGO39458.1 Short-chain dehydrogenase/reductase SDR [Penicillium expansum]KGO50053.1 Short-chain dehydrogenase/reductase SDR [Penicillium expansum]KGO55810.1 Short-chain dehydrogenase/reductase SDR [Penicillium expansum]
MPTALVTGASQGIGHAIALRLAEDGFDLAVNDIEAKKEKLEKLKLEIESLGRRSIVVVGDVSLEEEVNHMISSAVGALGNLTVMVANAGIILTKRLMDITPDEWDRVQAVNVRGMFLCYKAAGQQMIKQGGGGKIIGACSISGYRPVLTPSPKFEKSVV